MTMYRRVIDSPAGKLTLVAGDAGLAAVLWEEERAGRVALPPMTEDVGHPVLRETVRQLGEYFAGRRTTFELPLAPVGTAFQQRVWAGLLRIPFGKTWTYAALAAAAGSPGAARAAGAAAGRNPLSIIVPCHRAIGADGSLTGFAGGLARKAWLLEKEGFVGDKQQTLLFCAPA